MYARRAFALSSRSLSAPRSLQRASFASSSVMYSKAPSLSDITSDGGESFKLKKKESLDKLATQHEVQSQSVAKAPPLPASPPAASHASISTSSQDASSPAVSEESAEWQAAEAKDKKQGLLKTIFKGREETLRLQDEQIAKYYANNVARGKYVHSIVFHDVKPDKVDEYVELVGRWYPWMASMPENKVHLVGSWRTEVGECDTFVHIWEYQKYQGYHDSLHSISRHPDFPAFDKKLKTLIKSKKSSLMQEVGFFLTASPRKLGGIFELRSYRLKPGQINEWGAVWKRGVPTRLELMEGIGAWYVQIGELNTVHVMWQFADLVERERLRDESWALPGWEGTVKDTTAMTQLQKSSILVPCAWSPVA